MALITGLYQADDGKNYAVVIRGEPSGMQILGEVRSDSQASALIQKWREKNGYVQAKNAASKRAA